MGEIQDLENQIKQLQKELEQQKKDAAKMRKQLSDDNLKKLKAYERDMKAGIKQKDKETQKEYERLLKEYQESSNIKVQEAYMEMDEQYQKLLADTKEKENEWRQKNRELESHIKKLRKDTQKKEEAGIQEANRHMYEAGVVYKDIDQKPHEKFFPNRIKTFYDAISDARSLSRSGLNEAAIAIFISTKSGLNRLGFDIDEQYEEWVRLYNIFKSKVNLFRMSLDNEITDWNNMVQQTNEQAAKLNIDYWSSGEYHKMSNRIGELEKEVSDIEKNGIAAYLKKPEGFGIDELKNAIDEIDKMNEGLNKLSVLYKEKYKASCQRADWGESIIDFLEEEINLEWIENETHFKLVDAEMAETEEYDKYMRHMYGDSYEKVDTREWLELTFKNSVDTIINIYIIPYEKNEHVENRIVLNIDYNGAENMDYSRNIYSHICESIELEDDGIINFATDVEQLKTNMNKTLRETGLSISNKLNRIRK